jgi:glycosyltransferase involved in cell wall biosynthesis
MARRILFLSDVNSSHTRKWAISLALRGYEVGIFSLRKSELKWWTTYSNIQVFDEHGFSTATFQGGLAGKLKYVKLLPRLKKVIASFQPHLVHAHYATSYGLLGALSRFQPFVISVWGSDIYDFPLRSYLHKKMIQFNLNRATHVFSTSHIMAREIGKYYSGSVVVTPFGVDVELFSPTTSVLSRMSNEMVIGTVKSLEAAYGIDTLIKAFAKVRQRCTDSVRLIIAGDGTKRKQLEQLTKDLKCNEHVTFSGHIDHLQTPEYHRNFDVFVALSREESFGVALVEAMACGKPAVVSDASGFREVAVDGTTAIIVPRDEHDKAAEAILHLLNNPELRKQMGDAARQRVLENYNWEKNLDAVETLYDKMIL